MRGFTGKNHQISCHPRSISRGLMCLFFAAAILLSITATPQQSYAQDITTGLMGHWKFDDGTGSGTATDETSYGHDLTLNNMDANTDWVPGLMGTHALDFDGTNQYAEAVFNDPDYDDLPEISGCNWFYTRGSYSGNGPFTVVFRENAGGRRMLQFAEITGNSGELQGAVHLADDNEYTVTTGSLGADYFKDSWHHVCVTFDRNLPSARLKIYVDGAEAGSSNAINNAVMYNSGSSPGRMQIAFDPFWGTYLDGQVDDVRIYNRALTAEDVAELAAKTHPGKIRYNTNYRAAEYHNGYEWVAMGPGIEEPTAGLVGHWKFDDTTGSTTAADETSYNNPLTLTNMDENTDWVTGRIDGALDFDGTNERADGRFDENDYSLLPALSGCNWFYSRADYSGTGPFTAVMRETGGSFDFLRFAELTNTSGELVGAIRLTDDNYYTVTTGNLGASYFKNSWHHVCVTFDQSLAADRLKIYVDGALAGTDNAADFPMDFDNSGQTGWVYVGENLGTGANLDGMVDDVRMYNRALTPHEIQELHSMGKPDDVTNGLIAYWKMDEKSGTAVADVLGVSDGTWTGGPTIQTATGINGGAFHFTNTNGYVDLGQPAPLDIGTSDFTFSTWINTPCPDMNCTIVPNIYRDLASNGSGAGFHLRLSNTGDDLFVHIHDGTNLASMNTSSDVIKAYTWHHIVLSVDKSSATGAKLYVDKVEVASTDPTSVGSITNAISSTIGSRGSTTAEVFTGKMDEMRIYNRALSSAEVATMYDAYFCANPTRRLGSVIYNTTSNVAQFCDGEDWIAMGPVPGAGGGGCTHPGGSAGSMKFNTVFNAMQYCDGADWVKIGGPIQAYAANGVTFDGTNDYLYYNGGNVGPYSKMWTGSFWFRRNGNTGVINKIFETRDGGDADACNNASQYIEFNAANRLHIRTRSAGLSTPFEVTSSITITDSNWHHAMFSIDSGNSLSHLYIDGINRLGTPSYNTSPSAAFGCADESAIGSAYNGASKFQGDLADFWFEVGSYLDLSQQANRDKFYNSSTSSPVFLGTNGNDPLGVQNDVYLQGETSNWHTNKGSRGGFTENGALTDAATDPP